MLCSLFLIYVYNALNEINKRQRAQRRQYMDSIAQQYPKFEYSVISSLYTCVCVCYFWELCLNRWNQKFIINYFSYQIIVRDGIISIDSNNKHTYSPTYLINTKLIVPWGNKSTGRAREILYFEVATSSY